LSAALHWTVAARLRFDNLFHAKFCGGGGLSLTEVVSLQTKTTSTTGATDSWPESRGGREGERDERSRMCLNVKQWQRARRRVRSPNCSMVNLSWDSASVCETVHATQRLHVHEARDLHAGLLARNQDGGRSSIADPESVFSHCACPLCARSVDSGASSEFWSRRCWRCPKARARSRR
jgi:hypothetical protein